MTRTIYLTVELPYNCTVTSEKYGHKEKDIVYHHLVATNIDEYHLAEILAQAAADLLKVKRTVTNG